MSDADQSSRIGKLRRSVKKTIVPARLQKSGQIEGSLSTLSAVHGRSRLRPRSDGDSMPGRGQRIDERGGLLARRRYQHGTLEIRNGWWIGRYRDDIWGSNGKVRRVRRTVKLGTLKQIPTAKLARRRLEQYLSNVNALGYRPGRESTFAQFVERWRRDVLPSLKPSSQRAAEWHLRSYLLPSFAKLNLDEIAVEYQQQLVTRLATLLCEKTVRNVIATLSTILTTAKKWGYICTAVNSTALHFPQRTEPRRFRFFTPSQAQQIIARAEEPFATVFTLAALTGLRAGELFALKVQDLDFEQRTIRVQRSVWYGTFQTPKSKSSVRLVHMPDSLVSRLRARVEFANSNPEALLFSTRNGTPFNSNNIVQRKLWPILDSLGIPRCGMHAFRHTHSTLLVQTGAPVSVAQAQLGHSDPRITLSIYTHVLPGSQREAVEKVARILDPSWTLMDLREKLGGIGSVN